MSTEETPEMTEVKYPTSSGSREQRAYMDGVSGVEYGHWSGTHSLCVCLVVCV